LRRSGRKDIRLLRDLERYALRGELAVYYLLGLLGPGQVHENRVGKGLLGKQGTGRVTKAADLEDLQKKLEPRDEYERGWLDGRVSTLRWALNLHHELLGTEDAG
jgi:hypothetical protein